MPHPAPVYPKGLDNRTHELLEALLGLPAGAPAPVENRTPVEVTEASADDLDTTSLGFDPEDFNLLIQFNALGTGTARIEVFGPAALWSDIDESGPPFSTGEIAHLDLRYSKARVVYTATTGGLASVFVVGRRS